MVKKQDTASGGWFLERCCQWGKKKKILHGLQVARYVLSGELTEDYSLGHSLLDILGNTPKR